MIDMNGSSDRPRSGNPAAVILLAVFGIAAVVLALYFFGSPGAVEGHDDLARNDPANPDQDPIAAIEDPAGDGFAPERVLIPAPEGPAERQTSVSGTMFDPDGNPLPDQYVVFRKRDPAGAEQDIESAVESGADGAFGRCDEIGGDAGDLSGVQRARHRGGLLPRLPIRADGEGERPLATLRTG